MADNTPSTSASIKVSMKSFSLKTNPRNEPVSDRVKTVLGKRPRSALGSSRYSDEEYGDRGGYEEVQGFDAAEGWVVGRRDGEGRNGGGRSKGKGPLVIERVRNTDWKSEVRRRNQGKNLLPKEVQEAKRREAAGGKGEMDEGEGEGEGEVKWGLTVTKKKVHESNGDADTATTTITTTTVIDDINGHGDELGPPKTADEIALDALLGKTPKAPDLVIHRDSPSSIPNPESGTEETGATAMAIPKNETEAYRLAAARAPSPSTLDDYERIPVADFGAALLRGMGWKGDVEGGENGKGGGKGGIKMKKRRPNLLGLGADEKMVGGGEAEELGAWVGKADVRRLRGIGGKGGSGGGGGKFVKPSDYVRGKEREREERDGRDGRGVGGGGRYRKRERSRERGSRRDDRDRERDRERDHRRR